MTKYLSTRWLLTLGLTSIVVSVLLLAQFIGVLPDHEATVMQARGALAEAVAAGTVGRLGEPNSESIRALLAFLIERQPQLLSAGLRRQDGALIAQAGDHGQRWRPPAHEQSTPEQIVVPLHSKGERWGQMELLFSPLHGNGWLGLLDDDRLRLIAFFFLACTLSFYLYLRRMLRNLDPSRAVPERVRAAFDTLAEGVLLIDANEYILLANRSFADLIGADPAKLVGRRIDSFAWTSRDGGALAGDPAPWRLALQHNRIQQHDYLSLADRGGARRAFQINCSPIQSVGERTSGALISLQDVTELETTQAELRESKAQADDANRAKSEFLANMSHEIRTPMNAILGFTEVLRRGARRDAADTARHLETIHRNGRNLLELINGILDLSKVESGRLEIESVECQPHRIINEVIEVLSVRARDKGVALRFVADGPVPLQRSLDATRLRQIVTNLVGNAIKFTDQGEVVVVERWRDDATAPRLEIDVRDSGIGIPDDKLGAIFEPFVQAEGSTTRRYGGTGLGLAISRKFARAMGGDITVVSTAGSGSTFTLALAMSGQPPPQLIPAGEAQAVALEPAAPVQRDWQFAPARVLVVDDSPENRELVRLVLEDVGLELAEAENGRIAVDKVLSEPFALVLMDVHMPVMDGFAAVRALRAQGVVTPVIAFTADALKGFERQIDDAGFSGYLTKPIDVDAMMALLRGYLPTVAAAPAPVHAPVHAKLPAASSQRPAPKPGTAHEPVVVEPAGLRPATPAHDTGAADDAPIISRLASNPKLVRVIAMFVERLPKQIASMHGAATDGDWRTVAELAHWLKGSGGSVGFDVFTEPARRLERHARDGDLEAAREALQAIAALAARLSIGQGPATSPSPALAGADERGG